METDFELSDDRRYWLRDEDQQLEVRSRLTPAQWKRIAEDPDLEDQWSQELHLCDHRCAPLDADEGVRHGGRYCECPCHPWNQSPSLSE